MNFNLIPIPASEELAIGYVPPVDSSNRHTIGETFPFRLIAALYLLVMLPIFQVSSGDLSPDAQPDAAEAAKLAEASCADCT